MTEPWVTVNGANSWQPHRLGMGDYDIVVRGTGVANDDDTLLQAAMTQIISWGKGRLILQGEVIQTTALAFGTAEAQIWGMDASAALDVRNTTDARVISWNLNFDPMSETTYAFTMESAFADRFYSGATALSDGQWVALFSNDAITGNAPHSGLGYYQYPLELHQVHEWDGVGNYGHTACPIVDYMTTTPLFCKLTPTRNVMICNLNVFWGSGTAPGDYKRMFSLANCAQPRIYNVRFPRSGPGTLEFEFCSDIDVDCWGAEGMANTSSGYDGTYGITVNGCNGGKIQRCNINGFRHQFTTIGDGSTDRRGTPMHILVQNNICYGPPVKLNDTPTWDERVVLDTHSEGYDIQFRDNTIYLTGTTNNCGINSRSRATKIIGNTIIGGNLGSSAKPINTDGILFSGPDAVIERNYIERVANGIRTNIGSSGDYEIYATRAMVIKNTFKDIRHQAIQLAGDNHTIEGNVGDNVAYDSLSSPQRLKSAIQLGSIKTSTITSFSGDTVTTSAAHSMAISCQVRFRDGGSGLPPEITEWTYYWVVERPSTTQIKVSATKGGSAISFTTNTNTNYVEGYQLPGTGIKVYGNTFPKQSNSYFLATLGKTSTDVDVAGNIARGYGVGTSIFDDTYGESAGLWSAFSGDNWVD